MKWFNYFDRRCKPYMLARIGLRYLVNQMHEVFANLADGGRLHQRRRARSWCPVCERPTQEPEALCVEHAAFWMAGAAADGARDVLAILGPHKDLAGAAGDAIRAAIAVLEDDRRAANAEAAIFAEVLRA